MPDPQPPTPDAGDPLLTVRHLKTYFPVKRGLFKHTVGHVRAVDDVSFEVAQGETLGLVGESGCGKSTVGRTILKLVPATGGEVRYKGQGVLTSSGSKLKKLRRQMQMIFQDPAGSLNPRMTVGNIVGEPMLVHGIAPRGEIDDRVAELLVKVGLRREHMRRYPHEFSGGQRQRIGIARALAVGPHFIVADEPVSALDVSVQSQVLNLLNDLQDEFDLSYLFIAHNLAVVEHFCDRIAVMYLGRIVELGTRDQLYANPMHPYTRALLSAAPTPDPAGKQRRIMLAGEVPSPIFLFKDEGAPVNASGDERESPEALAALRDRGYEVITRSSLLDRPDLVPVPNEPGHFVCANILNGSSATAANESAA